MISTEERNEQFNYTKHLREQLLEGEKPHSQDVVWHYTNGEGLIGIISSGEVYATQASCLNDNTEIRYAAQLVRKALIGKANDVTISAAVSSFLKRFAKSLDDTDAEPNHAGSYSYVTCFSRLKDDLSQWRSYGGGENGYAVGFRACDLLGIDQTLIGSVNYDEQLHSRLAFEVANTTALLYEKGISGRSASEWSEWSEAFLGSWDSFLSAIAPFVKHPGFASEKEFRLVHSFMESDYPSIVVRQKNTLLARHLRLKLPMGFSNGDQRLPIHSIMVGPSRHKAVSAISVGVLLKKHGYPAHIAVFASNVPYQTT